VRLGGGAVAADFRLDDKVPRNKIRMLSRSISSLHELMPLLLHTFDCRGSVRTASEVSSSLNWWLGSCMN
jgi:hypothetical protein